MFWKGGVLETDPMPASEAKLEVMYRDFFHPNTSHTNNCLKHCPECGTYYLWDFEYEYLVNGSEDDLNLTRLSETEAKEWLDKFDTAVKFRIKNFRARVQKQIDILKTTNTIGALKEAIEEFEYAHNEGFDFEGIFQDLVTILIHHKHSKSDKCPGKDLIKVLLNVVKRNPQYKKEMLAILRNADLKPLPPEVDNLTKSMINLS